MVGDAAAQATATWHHSLNWVEYMCSCSQQMTNLRDIWYYLESGPSAVTLTMTFRVVGGHLLVHHVVDQFSVPCGIRVYCFQACLWQALLCLFFGQASSI